MMNARNSTFHPLELGQSQPTTMTDRARRVIGAAMGLVVGLVYGLTSGFINSVTLWGIPLRVDAGAILAETVFAALGAMVIGYITAWPQSSFKGILGGAVSIALFQAIRAFVNQRGGSLEFFGALIVLVATFLPAVALALPIAAVLRLGVNWVEEAQTHSGRPRLWRLARAWAIVILISLIAGTFSQMSSEEQTAMRRVNTLIRNGMTAQSEAEVPQALRTINNFQARAVGGYTLAREVDVSRDTSFADSVSFTTIIVDVRFDNGLHFRCLVGQALTQPLCSE
jgi:hypothetical protein